MACRYSSRNSLAWRSTGGPRNCQTLVDLLTERLELLGPARLLAQIGAVIGREFSVELAAAAGDIKMEALNDSVERLLASGLVHPTRSRDVMMFKHALVQDAAYDTILLRTRRQLHSRIADTIVSRFPALAEGRARGCRPSSDDRRPRP